MIGMIKVIHSAQPRMAQMTLRKELKEKLPVRDELNYVCLDMTTTLLKDLADECGMLPLGYEKKVVVAENFDYLAAKNKRKVAKGDSPDLLLKIFEDPEPDVDVYLLVWSAELDKKSPFYKALTAGKAEIQLIAEYTPDQWRMAVTRAFQKRNVEIDPDAVEELINRIEGDFGRFQLEVSKLANYASGERVTKKIVETLVSPPLESDSFALSNALTRGDRAEALRIYHDLSVRGTDAVYLFLMLAGQFRFLNQAQYLIAQGDSPEMIASKLRCSPGKARVAFSLTRKAKQGVFLLALEGIYHSLDDLYSGKVDPNFAFTRYVADFSL